MHKTADDPRSVAEWADTHQVSAGMDGDEACLRCHEPLRADPAAHTRHAPESAGSRCYNCHMPYTSYGLLKAIRSHTVGSPSAAETVQLGRPNACNLCHLDKTLAWTAEALEEWYDLPAPPLRNGDRTVAAGLRWMLAGDAGLRALTAWSMGLGAGPGGVGDDVDGAPLGRGPRRPLRRGAVHRRPLTAQPARLREPRLRLRGPAAGAGRRRGPGAPGMARLAGRPPATRARAARRPERRAGASTPCGGSSTPATGGPSSSENSAQPALRE